MLIAKTDEVHAHLKEQFKSRTIKKEYCAVVVGTPKFSFGTIDRKLARHPKDINKMVISDKEGKEAITDYTTERTFGKSKERFSLLKVKIHTGR
jgi:23S rRNA pseudouridine1911/1915/1917 synthase